MKVFCLTWLHPNGFKGVIVEHLDYITFIFLVVILDRYFRINISLSNNVKIEVEVLVHFFFFYYLLDSVD